MAYTLALRGDEAQSSGWMSRVVRLLGNEPEGAEHGYLVYLDFEEALGASDRELALAHAERVRTMGEQYGDPTLVALGVLGEGRIRVRDGAIREGMALLKHIPGGEHLLPPDAGLL